METDHTSLSLITRDVDSASSQCGTGVKGDYDTFTHLVALVLILVLSTLACGFPQISRRFSKTAVSGHFIFISQHFGTGVLIATAFVHLLPTAFISLTHPCLGPFFTKTYPSLAGLIAMISALSVIGLEMYLTLKGASHSHCHSEPQNSAEGSTYGKNSEKSYSLIPTPKDHFLQNIDGTEEFFTDASPSPLSTSKFSQRPPEMRSDDLEYQLDELSPTSTLRSEIEGFRRTSLEINQNFISRSKLQQERQIIQCFMLETGILFHSIFIGMAVSVATGPQFIVFLIAIGFHQSFEGLALGSRIAAINFPSGSSKPWLMVLAYGITTPIGQAFGLCIHNLYDPYSSAGLLVVGAMNAISSGLLLYAGLVQLLAEDFLSNKSYKLLKGKQRLSAFLSVIAGAFLMALVGVWA